MTPKEAFKVGFLHKCAEDGLTKEETLKRIRDMRIIKAAQIPLVSPAANAAGGVASSAGKLGLKTLLASLLLGPPLAGLAGGYGLAQAKDETYSKGDAKKRELLAAYERATSQLERGRRKRMTQV